MAEPQASGNYTVVARRYRPRQFAELIGQEPVAQALTNALKAGRVAHAYLFTGARGVGKTSCARILAKALNCERGPTPTPCDQCEPCRGITAGEDIDVLEIDGASNRGIDEVRSIRQNVHTRPSRCRYKVYIVDEVHMLTAPAFNALLKTLEEPPAHVKFIFATTEVQKIPVTILSRCQRFDFAGIGTSKIVDRLRGIAEAEGTAADEDALQLVARRAGGSMRDAQSLLDQLLAFGEGRLTADTVHRLLGTAADDRVAELAGRALAKDPAGAVRLLNGLADEGLQLGELLDQLIEYWRGLMLVNCSGGDWADLPVSGPHRQALRERAAATSLDTILAGLDILTAAKARQRGSGHGQVLLEMALVRLSRLEELLSVTQLIQSAQAGEVLPRPAEPQKKSEPAVAAAAGKSHHQQNGTAASAPSEKLTADSLPQVWSDLTGSLGGVLSAYLARSHTPAIFGPNALEIRFPAEYKDAYEYCSESTRAERLTAALRKWTGESWSIRFDLDRSAPQPAAAAPAGKPAANKPARVPLLQRAIEVFDAKVLRIDPEFGSADPPGGEAARG